MARRAYRSDSIVVHWNSELCIHTGRCLAALPEVFDNKARPWVAVDAAGADEIARAVEHCPTAALTYERLDGGPEEETPEVTSIVPIPNGPLSVHGRIEVKDVDGATFTIAPRAALCRCGASQNQPFCDRSHAKVGFRDNPRVIAPRRLDAESPDEATSS